MRSVSALGYQAYQKGPGSSLDIKILSISRLDRLTFKVLYKHMIIIPRIII